MKLKGRVGHGIFCPTAVKLQVDTLSLSVIRMVMGHQPHGTPRPYSLFPCGETGGDETHMTTQTAIDTPESSTMLSPLICPVPLGFFYHILRYGMTARASPVQTPIRTRHHANQGGPCHPGHAGLETQGVAGYRRPCSVFLHAMRGVACTRAGVLCVSYAV